MSIPSNDATVLAASTVTTVGAVIAVTVGVGAIVYLFANLRAARPEIGSEIELAPNRKPYLSDEELETVRLDRTLRWAVVLLVIVAVSLPAYWLAEPGRQSGAIAEYGRVFASRGEERFVEGSACQDCHGAEGSGGQAPYTITDGDGEFVASVQWRAPALDTVLLRYTRDEVKYIINYGRPFSPMVGWGSDVNKGPLNDQQIENLIDYFETIQLSPDETRREAATQVATELGLLEEGEVDEDAIDDAIEEIDYTDPEVGQILFNLGRDNGFAGGAYSCGRCHTRGWSIITSGEDAVSPADADLSDYTGFPDGSGALGPNLTGGLIPRQFASVEELVEFIGVGSVDGELYGENGVGSGKMPGFGDNPNTEAVEGDGMLSPEMLEAIATYEASLPPADNVAGTSSGESTLPPAEARDEAGAESTTDTTGTPATTAPAGGEG